MRIAARLFMTGITKVGDVCSWLVVKICRTSIILCSAIRIERFHHLEVVMYLVVLFFVSESL
jgi:hypothetical protein